MLVLIKLKFLQNIESLIIVQFKLYNFYLSLSIMLAVFV